jgi:peptidoglycan hydrolase CwlO-like protein
MKKAILLIILTGFVMGSTLTGSQSTPEKIINAGYKPHDITINRFEVKNKHPQSKKDSIQQFKDESYKRISNNDKLISELKTKISGAEKATKEEYEKLVARLEEKNRELKIKLDEFNEKSKEKWHKFKKEFNHEMDELGNSIKDLTSKNKK